MAYYDELATFVLVVTLQRARASGTFVQFGPGDDKTTLIN